MGKPQFDKPCVHNDKCECIAVRVADYRITLDYIQGNTPLITPSFGDEKLLLTYICLQRNICYMVVKVSKLQHNTFVYDTRGGNNSGLYVQNRPDRSRVTSNLTLWTLYYCVPTVRQMPRLKSYTAPCLFRCPTTHS